MQIQRFQLRKLCVQNQWEVPKYVNLKEGPDHKPYFTANVTVNGFCFQSSNICRTLKAAQNNAALIALNHFSGSGENRNSLDPNSLPKPDEQHWYKNRLQTYAQKKMLDLPTYSSERICLQHASCFKSKVTVGGQSYESTKWFLTKKEAENDVAKIAFQQVSPNEYKKDDSGLHKNALQELAHRRGFLIPTYMTKSHGPVHSLTFLSTVMVGGKFYLGLAARNKKQAEVNAAKSAYDALQNVTNAIGCQTQLENPCVVSEQSKEQTAGKMPKSPTPCENELEAREVSKELTADTGKMPRSPTPCENELEAREKVSKEEMVDSEKGPRSPIPSKNELKAREKVSKEQIVDTGKNPTPCENGLEAREGVSKEHIVDARKMPRSPTPCEKGLEARERVSKEHTDARKMPRNPAPCENEQEIREVSKEQIVDTRKRSRSSTPCENELKAREEISKEQTVDTGKSPRNPTPCENELEVRGVSKELTVDARKMSRSPTPCENEKRPRSSTPCENELEAREVSKDDSEKRPRSPTPCENEPKAREVSKEQTVGTKKKPRSSTPCENEPKAREVSKEQTIDTRKRLRSSIPCEIELKAREGVTVKRHLHKILVYPWPKVPNM